MSANHDDAPSAGSRPVRGRSWAWAWPMLAIALGVVALIRVPLVLNAGAHLDSDLAVDGLTLVDAMNGHWRWHYPATPFIGSPPVLLSWVQARVWGPTPMTLVSGGVVAYGLIVVATFLMNRRAFGPSVAAWGLVPLTFASTGTLWLSGRVTGGHLLAVAWHAGAFVLLRDALVKDGWWRSAALGLWCGFGLYIDSMFALTWVGMGVGMLVWAVSGPSPGGAGEADGGISPTKANRFVRGLVWLLMFALAAGVGVAPRFVGKWFDPHDAYGDQFQPVIKGEVQIKNAQFLAMDCLPRLVAGHRLMGLQADPEPSSLPGGSPSPRTEGTPTPWFALSVALVALFLFARAILTLWLDPSGRAEKGPKGRPSPVDPARSAIRWGLLASSFAAVAGFLVAGNITNSDNYRYLVFLLVPWSSGFGLLMARMASKGPGGAWVAAVVALAFASLMTIDSAKWYARLGWIDEAGRPVRKAVDDPVRDWLDDHLRITVIYGSYWDVYRLSFLTGGRVRGVPFGEYPQRFPEIKASLPAARNRAMIARADQFGPIYRARALAKGGRETWRGEGFSIIQGPERIMP